MTDQPAQLPEFLQEAPEWQQAAWKLGYVSAALERTLADDELPPRIREQLVAALMVAGA